MRPQSGRILFLGLWPLRGHLFIRKKIGASGKLIWEDSV